MSVHLHVVILREHAADSRLHAQHVEIISADQFAADALGPVAFGKTHRHRPARQHVAEDLIAIANIAIRGIGNAVGIAALRAAKGSGSEIESDEFLRIL